VTREFEEKGRGWIAIARPKRPAKGASRVTDLAASRSIIGFSRSGAQDRIHPSDIVFVENLFVARIVRPMLRDVDGLPLVGTKAKCLGIRPVGPHADVDLNPPGDVNGDVVSNDKGLSVGADWRMLPGHLIPEHLNDGMNGARGKNLAVYVHGNGSGPFVEGVVAPGLEMILKAGSLVAGVIRPVATVRLTQYQSDLAATRPNWVNDES
jgi:hypothetical protein